MPSGRISNIAFTQFPLKFLDAQEWGAAVASGAGSYRVAMATEQLQGPPVTARSAAGRPWVWAGLSGWGSRTQTRAGLGGLGAPGRRQQASAGAPCRLPADSRPPGGGGGCAGPGPPSGGGGAAGNLGGARTPTWASVAGFKSCQVLAAGSAHHGHPAPASAGNSGAGLGLAGGPSPGPGSCPASASTSRRARGCPAPPRLLPTCRPS